MFKFLQQCTTTKCLFLGRPQAFDNLPEALAQSNRHIQMDQTSTGPDLEAFIDAGIGKVPILADPELRRTAFDTLRDNSRGMFLWGKLVIDDLHSSYSKHDVTEKLHNLPHGLEKAYEGAFLRLNGRLRSNEICLLRNVLTFVVSARRPLTVDELSWAHALQVKSAIVAEATPAQDFLLREPEKSILHVCGDFVSIFQNRVHLNHSSIKDFLIRDKVEWDRHSASDLSYFRVHLLEASGLLGDICFEYLAMEDHGFPTKDADTLDTIWKLHSFMEYASYNFVFHAVESCSDLERYSDRLKAFCSSSRVISWLDHLTFSWNENGFDWSLLETFEKFLESLDVASAQGIKTCLSNQLRLEMVYRSAQYGPDDLRTAPLTVWARHLNLDDNSTSGALGGEDVFQAISPVDESYEPATRQDQMTHSITRASHVPGGAPAITKAVQLLRDVDIVQSKHQVMVVVGALFHFMKAPLDPLNMLYHLLLEKALALPVYVLLAIGNYYYSLDKSEQSLEILKKGLPRVEGCGSRSEMLTYELMGQTYCDMGQYGHAIKYLLLTIGGHERYPSDNRGFLGCAYHHSGRVEEGLSSLGSILANDIKSHSDTHLCILQIRRWIATLISDSGRNEEALACFRHVVHLAAGRADLENEPAVLWAIAGVGEQLRLLSKYRESITWLEGKCLSARYDDKRVSVHFNLGESYFRLHTVKDGALTAALQHLEQCYILHEQRGKANAKNTALYSRWLARALKTVKRFEESSKYARISVKANSECYGDSSNKTMDALELVAETLDCLGRWEEGLEGWRNLLRIQEEHFQHDEGKTAIIQSRIHKCLSGLGRTEEAGNFRRKTVKVLVDSGQFGRANEFLRRVSRDAEEVTALEEAVEYLSKAAELEMKHSPPLVESFVGTQQVLFLVLRKLGKHEASLSLQRRLAKITRKNYGTKHESTLRVRYHLAIAFYDCGHYIEALGCWKDFRRTIIGTPLNGTEWNLAAGIYIGTTLEELGRLEDALVALEEAYCFREQTKLLVHDNEGWSKVIEDAWKLREELPQIICNSRRSSSSALDHLDREDVGSEELLGLSSLEVLC